MLILCNCWKYVGLLQQPASCNCFSFFFISFLLCLTFPWIYIFFFLFLFPSVSLEFMYFFLHLSSWSHLFLSVGFPFFVLPFLEFTGFFSLSFPWSQLLSNLFFFLCLPLYLWLIFLSNFKSLIVFFLLLNGPLYFW